MNHLIALDIGTRTGFAIRDTKGNITYGLHNFSKAGKFGPAGYSQLYHWLRGQMLALEVGEVMEVVAEKPHASKFFNAIKILLGLVAIVELFCFDHKVSLTLVSSKTVKKFWTGSGNAGKPEMVAQTQKRYPAVKDDNTSDAIALLEYHLLDKRLAPGVPRKGKK